MTWLLLLPIICVAGFLITKFTRPTFRPGSGWWQSYERFYK